MQLSSPLFGVVETGPDHSIYVVSAITSNGRPSHCSLFVSDEIFTRPEHVEKAERLLDRLERIDQMARKEIAAGLAAANATIVDFIDYHLEETPDEVAAKLGVGRVGYDVFVAGLDLCGVMVHLNEDRVRLGCDYSIGKDFSDQLLAVKFDEDGEFLDIAHES